MISLTTLLDGCPGMSQARKINLLHGPGKVPRQPPPAPNQAIDEGVCLILWVADLLSTAERVSDPDVLYLVMDTFAEDLRQAVNNILNVEKDDLIPTYRLSITDSRYVSMIDSSRILDLKTCDLLEKIDGADLKISLYNLTTLLLRRLNLAKKTSPGSNEMASG